MASNRSLTFVTLNTWKGGGDYGRRLRLMIEQIEALAPDVLFLQEVFVAPQAGVDTGEALANALGMSHLHTPARPDARWLGERKVDSTSGLSILSRTPLAASRRLNLPTDPRDGERVALITSIRWNATTLGLVDLHLTYLPDGDELRRRQLEAVLRDLTREDAMRGREGKGVEGEPVAAWLLAGDFNAETGSPALQWLREASGFAVLNAWDAAGGPCPTITEQEGSTTLGTRCVDHMVLLQPPAPPGFTFADAGRVLDRADAATGLLPSDHAGLRAVLMAI